MQSLIDKYATMDAIPAPTDADEAEYYGKICDAIEAMPTINAEPVRHGRWIESTSRGSYSVYCSYRGSHKETICPSEYCPTCGAQMDASDTKDEESEL